MPHNSLISGVLQTFDVCARSVSVWRLQVRILLAFVCELGMFGTITVDSVLHLASEGLDQSLNWPGSGVTEGADRVALDLEGELFKHIDFAKVSISFFDPRKYVDHPASSFSARCALSATFMLVELGKSQNGIDYICLLIHDNDGRRSQTTLPIPEVIKVHQRIVTLLLGEQFDGGATRNDCLEVVPSADDALTMSLDELPKWDAHLLLDRDWVVYVAGNAE